MGRHKRVDPDTEAALEVVAMEKKQEELKQIEQQERERLIAQSYEAAGQIKTAMMFSKFGDVSRLMWLKQVKDSKVYRHFGTWDSYCDYLGLDRHTIDQALLNLAAFGQDFLVTVSGLSVGYRELRKLRQLTAGGDVVIDAECVCIGDERIPLDQEHTEDLQAAIESLLEAKNKQIEEQQSTLSAKEKVLKDKEKLINKLAKDLTDFEGKAKKKGHTPEEEKFLKMVEDHKAIFDELFLKVDAENFMPADSTPRMKAAYVELVGLILRTAQGLYDTGTCAYDILPEADGWSPPSSAEATEGRPSSTHPQPLPSREGREDVEGEGEPGDDDRQELDDCRKCKFHKRLGSKLPGVKIPGGYGKCIRPEGHCNPAHPNTRIRDSRRLLEDRDDAIIMDE